ncbi:hypothetical protein [Arsukibacterium perlucidum]|uniref:hypothetical protein n=1 Tax=Arsukibacterium perlucidum TaxID=368811 RepID=UPI00036B4E9E|nr:hypothetical protein [Arsukibacterium perlucidum]
MKYIIIVLLFCLPTTLQAVDFKVSGYGSIVGGKVVSGDLDPSGEIEFQVDFYDYAYYVEDWAWDKESLVALQMVASINNRLDATIQLVAKAADEWSPDIDWFYLTYKLNDSSKIMAGRRMLPMYYFSEYMEVGFAYPWIRPPANLYWWEITQFNGLTYLYNFELGNWNLDFSAFMGEETQTNIKSHDFWRNRGGYYFPPAGVYISGTADVSWSDIIGVNLAAANDWLDIRASYFSTRYTTTSDVMFFDELDSNGDGIADAVIERRTNPDGTPIRSGQWSLTDFDLSFYGLGGSMYFKYATVLFDYNYVTYDDGYGSRFPTFYVSAIYNHDTWQPYVGMSQAKLKITEDFDGFGTGEAEEHQIITLGLRYNVMANAALKFELNKFKDKGDRSPWYDFSYHNDATLFSVALDFIF